MPLAAHHKAALDETDGVLEPSADLVHDAERPAHNGKREGVVNRFGQPERLGALSERGVELTPERERRGPPTSQHRGRVVCGNAKVLLPQIARWRMQDLAHEGIQSLVVTRKHETVGQATGGGELQPGVI